MRLSRIYLGLPIAHEEALRGCVRSDLGRLHVRAQRVAWGMLFGEQRMVMSLDAECRRLLDDHHDEFMAHVTVALVRRYQHRDADAERHLDRARALVTPDHPWATMMPSEAAWRCDGAPVLEEVEAGRVYRVAAPQSLAGRAMGAAGVSTLIRTRSGGLVYINPIELPAAIADQIRALGEVTHIVSPAKYHYDFVPQAQRLFPRARTFGVPAQRGYWRLDSVRFDGFLDDAAPLFPGEIEQITMRGVEVGDVWFLDRPSGTLLVTDAIVLPVSTEWGEHFRPAFAHFYAWAWGLHDRPGVPSYQPSMWSDLRAYQTSLRRALAHDFHRVASSHGPWSCVDGDARKAVGDALGWLLALEVAEARRLFLDFVARHPLIFARKMRDRALLAIGRRPG